MPNSLDPDQVPQNVETDLDPTSLIKLDTRKHWVKHQRSLSLVILTISQAVGSFMLQVHLLFTFVLSKGLLFRFEKALDKGPVLV